MRTKGPQTHERSLWHVTRRFQCDHAGIIVSPGVKKARLDLAAQTQVSPNYGALKVGTLSAQNE